MSRRAFLPFVIALVFLAVAAPALAAPLRQGELRLEIISPAAGSEIRGIVPIIGSAVVPNFQFYKVEWGIGSNPSQWAVIGSIHDSQVTNNQLEVWDTNSVPDDTYTLRLTGVKNDGNWEEYVVRNLRVSNTAPASTATPTVTPTPEGTLTPTPTPDEASSNGTPAAEAAETPEVTETEPPAGVQIIAPTAAIMGPTATPELGSESADSLLPFDTESLKDAFVFGGLAMAAVFVLVGVVFGIRRLI
ncbi:MAG: hypothetical protein GXX94_04505 [Chloroflexi bacterium]|nr:hypothetical protein [Chloroflexota bacterium]